MLYAVFRVYIFLVKPLADSRARAICGYGEMSGPFPERRINATQPALLDRFVQLSTWEDAQGGGASVAAMLPQDALALLAPS